MNGLPTFNAPPLASASIPEFHRNRFWSSVEIRSENECWNWVGGINSKGYGRFHCSRKSFGAHRIAYALGVDDIPSGLNVCHECDNPICCNPSHLWLGTNKENVLDAKTKGRLSDGKQTFFHKNRHLISSMIRKKRADNPELFVRGEQVNTAILTEPDVVVIRRSSESNASLAKKYGVVPRTIHLCRIRKTWRHVK